MGQSLSRVTAPELWVRRGPCPSQVTWSTDSLRWFLGWGAGEGAFHIAPGQLSPRPHDWVTAMLTDQKRRPFD